MKVKWNGAESLASYQTAHAPILFIRSRTTFPLPLPPPLAPSSSSWWCCRKRNRNLLHHKLERCGVGGTEGSGAERSGDGDAWCGWVVFEIMLITSHDPDIRAARVLGGCRQRATWDGIGMGQDEMVRVANPNANADGKGAGAAVDAGRWKWRWRCARTDLSIFKHMEGIKWKSIKPKHVCTNHMKIDVHGSYRFSDFAPKTTLWKIENWKKEK